MTEKYRLPLTELSAKERGEYQSGIKLIVDGDVSGLKIALNVLENSRPFYFPGEPERTLSWAVEIIEAYRNLGRAIRNGSLELSNSESELREKLRKYENIILEDDDEAPYRPLFDTLDRFLEIHKILKEHEIENPEQLEEVLGTAEEESEGYFKDEVKRFGNNF
jgi:hypothetical protein